MIHHLPGTTAQTTYSSERDKKKAFSLAKELPALQHVSVFSLTRVMHWCYVPVSKRVWMCVTV